MIMIKNGAGDMYINSIDCDGMRVSKEFGAEKRLIILDVCFKQTLVGE